MIDILWECQPNSDVKIHNNV